MSYGRSHIKGPRFAFQRKENLMCCERCVFGKGQHASFCSLALSSAPIRGQQPDVRALKPGDRCEARVGRPGKWMDAVFNRFSGGLAFVTIDGDAFDLALSWKEIRLKPQRAATPGQHETKIAEAMLARYHELVDKKLGGQISEDESRELTRIDLLLDREEQVNA